MWWPGVHHRLTQATFYIFPTKNYYKNEKQQFLSFHVHFLSLDFFSFPIKMSLMHYLILFQLMIMCQTCASQPFNLTDGFLSLPLNQSNFDIQRPYSPDSSKISKHKHTQIQELLAWKTSQGESKNHGTLRPLKIHYHQ